MTERVVHMGVKRIYVRGGLGPAAQVCVIDNGSLVWARDQTQKWLAITLVFYLVPKQLGCSLGAQGPRARARAEPTAW